MGGGQSLRIGLGHLELFSAVASFSVEIPQDFETRFADLLKTRRDDLSTGVDSPGSARMRAFGSNKASSSAKAHRTAHSPSQTAFGVAVNEHVG